MLAIVRRMVQMLVLLAALSVVLFGLLSAMPGDPIDLLVTSNPRIKPEDIVRLKKLRGLDQPWHIQYLRWIWGYHAPRRPPVVTSTDAIVTELSRDGRVDVEVDVGPFVRDPDHPQHAALLRAALTAAGSPVRPGADLDGLSAALSALSVKAQKAVEEDVRSREAATLRLRGLFGARLEGTVLQATLDAPGIHQLWFTVQDSDGYTSVGAVTVAVAPPAPFDGASSDPGRLDGDGVAPGLSGGVLQHALDPGSRQPGSPHPPDLGPFAGVVREESPQLAGSTELPEPPPPRTREELLAAAEAAHTGPLLRLMDDAVVDDPATFEVDLNRLQARGVRATFALRTAEGSTGDGTISADGRFSRHFSGPGKSVITVDVTAAGVTRPAAFAVEHGPIADPNAFRPGFLFALTGDKEALGFSNTYKRPVWELLAGATIVCGDGEVGPGESCDDGGRVDGDGCSSNCQDERLGFFGRLDALFLSFLIAIPIGVLAAYKQYTWVDYLVNFMAFIGISLPVFWFGIMLLALFAEQLKWLPAGGIQTPGLQGGFWIVLTDRLRYAILPASVLAIAYAGRWLRYMRASMLEVLPLDYIRTARAKGLTERAVVLRHALRNALIPVVTVLALSVPTLFGGALLTEQVFSWPGIGRLQFETVMSNDSYVAIVVFLISAALVMLGNLLADVAYLLVDPRMRKK